VGHPSVTGMQNHILYATFVASSESLNNAVTVKENGDAMMELIRRISPKTHSPPERAFLPLLVQIKEVQLKGPQPVNERSPMIRRGRALPI
jgi:hypothetical protein